MTSSISSSAAKTTLHSPTPAKSTPPTSRSSSPFSQHEDLCNHQPIASTSQSDPFARPSHLLPVQLADLILDSSISSIPIEYTLQRLHAMGPRLLEASAKSQVCIPPPDRAAPRPSALRLTLPPQLNQSLKPTHVLAVSGFDNPSVTLVQPVFGLSYALNCTALPSLSQASFTIHPDGGFSVPAVYLSLPSIYCYPILHAWITCPSISNLMLNLIPGGSDMAQDLHAAPASRQACLSVVSKLAANCSAGQLMDKLNMLHGLRENVICLGMKDDTLWRVMALTNSLLCSALKQQQLIRSHMSTE